MLGILLMTVLNVTLYLGMIADIDGALNLAVFVMWMLAILNAVIMFASEESLLKTPDKHFLYVWVLRTFTVATVAHSIYWGYFFAPSMWVFSAVVLWVRKYELNNRKRF